MTRLPVLPSTQDTPPVLSIATPVAPFGILIATSVLIGWFVFWSIW